MPKFYLTFKVLCWTYGSRLGHFSSGSFVTKKTKVKPTTVPQEDKERSQKHRKEGSSSKGTEDAERKPKKKSQRKQRAKPSADDSSSDAERLEAFLGATDAPGLERAAEAYESL